MINDIIQKYISRKLVVFIVATVLLIFGRIGETSWLAVAGAYMAANLIDKAVSKNGKNGNGE